MLIPTAPAGLHRLPSKLVMCAVLCLSYFCSHATAAAEVAEYSSSSLALSTALEVQQLVVCGCGQQAASR